MNTKTQELPAMERIKGFPDYSITKCGRVFSHKHGRLKELKQINHSRGYLQVDLWKDLSSHMILVHQLLAIQFLNHKPIGNKYVVDHIDNNKTNNNLSNLQVITNRQNLCKDLKDRGLPLGVSMCGNKFRSQIKHNKKKYHLGNFSTPEQASQAYQKRLAEIESEAK